MGCTGDTYSFDISFYDNLPNARCTLLQCEEIYSDRNELYAIIREAKKYPRGSEKWSCFIIDQLYEKRLLDFLTLINTEFVLKRYGRRLGFKAKVRQKNARLVDHIGHYLLSLAYSENDETQRTFLQFEIDWFLLRSSLLSKHDLYRFLTTNKLPFHNVSESDKNNIKSSLVACSRIDIQEFDETQYFVVDMKHVVSLVAKRNIFLRNGKAFIPSLDLPYFFETFAHTKWKEKLSRCLLMLNSISSVDQRIGNIVNDFPKLKKQVVRGKQDIYLGEIENHVMSYYPLCMQNLHNQFKRDYLRFRGRLQYQGFLKDIGLPFEDAMVYWKSQFLRHMTPEQFVKNKYAYHVKYCYGLVGKKVEQKPYSCNKIIMDTPKFNENHGCPFAHFDVEYLSFYLEQQGLEYDNIQEILKLKEQEQFQGACGLFFEITQQRKLGEFSSPVDYYFKAKDIEDLP